MSKVIDKELKELLNQWGVELTHYSKFRDKVIELVCSETIKTISDMRAKVHNLRKKIIKSVKIPDCVSKKNVVQDYNTMLLIYDKILKELKKK